MDVVRRALRLALLTSALAGLLSGLVLMLSWVLPDFFHAFFPEPLLHALAFVQRERVLVGGAHYVFGSLTFLLAVTAAAERWMRGSKKGPRESTATTLFFEWLGTFAQWRRTDRLSLRESLRAPTVESYWSLAVAIATVILMQAPVALLKSLALAIHRANALYSALLVGYWILFLAFGIRARPRVAQFHLVSASSAQPRGSR